jgi:hypothetical protein
MISYLTYSVTDMLLKKCLISNSTDEKKTEFLSSLQNTISKEYEANKENIVKLENSNSFALLAGGMEIIANSKQELLQEVHI